MKNKIAFALSMGIITTGIISFSLIAINVGFIATFFQVWIKSWAIAYVIVTPTILIIGPRLQKIIDRKIP